MLAGCTRLQWPRRCSRGPFARRAAWSHAHATQMHYACLMKSAVIPQVRVEPELRAAIEAVLAEGESLSSFVESSVRKAVEYRRAQAVFHARGQASWEEFQRSGVSYSVDEVVENLQAKVDAKRKQLGG